MLLLGKLGSVEYVTLVGVFILASIIIHFKKDISEFSIVGNSVRLNKSTEEAKEAIRELKALRIDTFRMLLDVNRRTGGSFFYSVELVEHRAKEFIEIFNKIETSGYLNDLQDDLLKSVNLIFSEQLKGIKAHMTSQKETLDSYGDMPKPMYISFLVGSVIVENINQSSAEWCDTEEKVRSHFFHAIDNYSKLYVIKKKLDELINI